MHWEGCFKRSLGPLRHQPIESKDSILEANSLADRLSDFDDIQKLEQLALNYFADSKFNQAKYLFSVCSQQCQGENNPEYIFLMANCLFNLRFYQRAAESYSEVLIVDHSHCSARRMRAYCYDILGEPDKSLEDYLLDLVLNKDDFWLTKRISDIYIMKSQFNEARVFTKRALKLVHHDDSLIKACTLLTKLI